MSDLPFVHLVNPVTPEEREVLAPVSALFDAFTRRDKAAVLEQLLPDGSGTIIRNGQIIHFRLAALPDRLPDAHAEEHVFDPLIRIDDDIAVIWTKYETSFDGKLHHYGTNIISLIRHDGRWLIAGVVDNSRVPL